VTTGFAGLFEGFGGGVFEGFRVVGSFGDFGVAVVFGGEATLSPLTMIAFLTVLVGVVVVVVVVVGVGAGIEGLGFGLGFRAVVTVET
jgi:hypothetical protein